MTANYKNLIPYRLLMSLAIILAMTITGCKTPATAVPSASVLSPNATVSTTPQQRQGGSGNITATLPSLTTPPAITSPTSSAAQPSSTISTSIPNLSSIGTSTPIVGTPIILVTAPLDVSIVPAGDVTISCLVSNFNLVNKIDQPSVAGEGHIIYYKDVTFPTVQGQPATTDKGTYLESSAISYTWHNVGAGFHYFSVQLVNNDSTPLSTPITVTVYVTVQANSQSNPSPSSTITPVPNS